MEDEEETQQILKLLKSLKQASQQLQTNPKIPDPSEPEPDPSSSSSAIKALLELNTDQSDPNLSNLSHHLSDLKTLISSLQKSKVKNSTSSSSRIRSFLISQVKTHELTRVAESIESEIQAWIDRESIMNLTLHLKQIRQSYVKVKEDEIAEKLDVLHNPLSSTSFEDGEEIDIIVEKLETLHDRLSKGIFDINLQELLLKSKIFSEIEFLLCNCNVPQIIREKAGYALKGIVLFNKDVFVGQVLISETISSLISMDSLCSLEVLICLIKAIRSPLVDVIESVDGISKTISYLNSDDLSMKVMAMDCILEIAYFGRKEAIESMLNCGLIERLVELQRSELGGDLIDLGKTHQKDDEEKEGELNKKKKRKEKRGYGEKRYLEKHPFVRCVARFGVQLEVGEGLRKREKRGFKQEILNKIREACDTDAEAATIVAEVLWGSSP